MFGSFKESVVTFWGWEEEGIRANELIQRDRSQKDWVRWLKCTAKEFIAYQMYFVQSSFKDSNIDVTFKEWSWWLIRMDLSLEGKKWEKNKEQGGSFFIKFILQKIGSTVLQIRILLSSWDLYFKRKFEEFSFLQDLTHILLLLGGG